MVCDSCHIEMAQEEQKKNHRAACGAWCCWSENGLANSNYYHCDHKESRRCPNGCFDPKPLKVEVPDDCLDCGAKGMEPCKNDCPNR